MKTKHLLIAGGLLGAAFYLLKRKKKVAAEISLEPELPAAKPEAVAPPMPAAATQAVAKASSIPKAAVAKPSSPAKAAAKPSASKAKAKVTPTRPLVWEDEHGVHTPFASYRPGTAVSDLHFWNRMPGALQAGLSGLEKGRKIRERVASRAAKYKVGLFGEPLDDRLSGDPLYPGCQAAPKAAVGSYLWRLEEQKQGRKRKKGRKKKVNVK